jgi:hypothetical protein
MRPTGEATAAVVGSGVPRQEALRRAFLAAPLRVRCFFIPGSSCHRRHPCSLWPVGDRALARLFSSAWTRARAAAGEAGATFHLREPLGWRYLVSNLVSAPDVFPYNPRPLGHFQATTRFRVAAVRAISETRHDSAPFVRPLVSQLFSSCTGPGRPRRSRCELLPIGG